MNPVVRSGSAVFAALGLAAVLSCVGTQQAPAPLTPVQSRMREDLAYLASARLGGRLAGTPGNDSAAAFIVRRYEDLGLIGPFSGNTCGMESCGPGFLQAFRISLWAAERVDIPIDRNSQNVAAVVTGTDSVLRQEYVVVGAHYDHIGRSHSLALDASAFRAIHPGADDNASGTSAVLELARRFATRPARRSVLFVNFSAEELGLVGSAVFLDNSPVPINSMVTMVNLDMVGRLRGNQMILFSGEDNGRFRIIADSVEHIPPVEEFRLGWQSIMAALSDHVSFAKAHVPTIGLFTDYHPDYHRPGDTVDRINFEGLEKIVDFTERLVRAVADGNEVPGRR